MKKTIEMEIWRTGNRKQEERHHFLKDQEVYLFGYNAKVISRKAAKKIREIVEADILKS